MPSLHLALDNVTTLPDGGPTTFTVEGARSVDIGRNTYLDWTLPDPERVISGRHCEIHFRDGGYWLHDVSRNGTYLNGSEKRLTEPTELRDGDRVAIGDYLVSVAITLDDAPARVVEAPPVGDGEEGQSENLWDVPNGRAAPAERPERQRRAATPVQPDVLDWAADLPKVERAPQAPAGWDAAPPDNPLSQDAPAAWDPPQPREAAPADMPQTPAEPSEPADDNGAAVAAGLPNLAARTPNPTTLDLEPPIEAPPVDAPPEEPAARARPSVTELFLDPAPAPVEPLPVETPPAEPSVPDPPQPDTAPLDRGFTPPPAAPRPAPAEGDFAAFVEAFAGALDIAPDRLAGESPEALGARVGLFVQLTLDGMQKLLKARAASRGFMKAGAGTQVQAVGNNPLKFMPTPAAAADVLFGPPSRSYLPVEQTLSESFADLGSHQVALYSAMQDAVERMLADLSPEAIEAEKPSGSWVSSKEAKAWEIYKERYTARASQHDNGMVDVFMMCFSDAYERAMRSR